MSTNIAETSLTIDDVVFVVDSGKAKQKVYNHETRITTLNVVWIARSNSEQRAGRAGRCRNGYCFRLYSRKDYEEKMEEFQTSEIMRSSIHVDFLKANFFFYNLGCMFTR